MSVHPHVVLTQGADIALSLGRPGWLESRLSAVGSPADVVREPAGRLDVVLQRLEAEGHAPDISVPPGLRPWFAAQFRTALSAPGPALGVLTVLDELRSDVWRHREGGFLVQPPPNRDRAWDGEQRSWLSDHFELTPAPTPADSASALTAIAAAVADDAVLAVLNVSTYDPAGVRYDFSAEVWPIRAHRLDLELERAASAAGCAVIDVDRIIAEYGGDRAVHDPGTYSGEASAVIAEEAMNAIIELGVAGLSFEGDVMRLDVPAYDRRTSLGRIDVWHVTAGSDVERGAPLFDLTFENLVHRLDYAAQETNRSMSLTVLAADSGRVASVAVADGAEVEVGQTVGVMVTDASVEPVGVDDLDGGVPPFRIGIRVK